MLDIEFGTYYINPSQWDPKIRVIELSPRILTYLRSPAFEGGDYVALFKAWAEAVRGRGVPVKVNVHGPYGRMSRYPLKKWEQIVDAMSPLIDAVRDVGGEIAVTFYDRFTAHKDVRVLVKVAEMLEEKKVRVALRPTIWYMPSDLKHKMLTGVATTIDFAKMYGLGVNLDPENVFTRLLMKYKGDRKKAAEETESVIIESAKINKSVGVPQFGRFAPFKVLKAGAKLGRTIVRMKALKVLLPWSEREKSDLPVEKQMAMLAVAGERVGQEVYAVYNSTKDKERVREKVVMQEVRELLPYVLKAKI